MVAFVKQGLQDLSITRSTFDWGIPVPWDEDHVLYVWIDALLNYVTAAGYGTDPERFEELWPVDVHLVGKDILRFHAVIWPAMLMAAEVAVPRQVFAHGWLLVGGEKMSKSKLTAIAPHEITDHFGSDAFRYYFLRDDPVRLGRLVLLGAPERGLHLRARQRPRQPGQPDRGDGRQVLRRRAAGADRPRTGRAGARRQARRRRWRSRTRRSTALAFQDALAAINELVGAVNGYVTEQEPWKVAKDESQRARLATILYTRRRDAARGRRTAQPDDAEDRPRSCGTLLGAEAKLGALADQRGPGRRHLGPAPGRLGR